MATSIWGLPLISTLNPPIFTYTLNRPNMAHISNTSNTNNTNNFINNSFINNHNNNIHNFNQHNYNHNNHIINIISITSIININTSSTTRNIILSLPLTPFHPPPLTLVPHRTPLSLPVTS